jgi:hypothetical protein
MPFENPQQPAAAQPQTAYPVAPTAPEVTVGSLLSRTFGVWSRSLWRFFGFTLVLLIPVFLLAALGGVLVASRAAAGEIPRPGAMAAVFAVLVPLMVVVSAVQMGGLTHGGVRGLAGQPVRIGGMFSSGFGRILPLVGAMIVVGVCVMLGLVLLIVPGVILACGFSTVFAVVVAERKGPLEAMARSWELTRGHRGTYFLAVLVMLLVLLGVGLVAGALNLIPILGQLVGLFVQILFGSLGTLLPAVAYHDLRVLKEGTPTEELARVFE